MKTNGMAMRCVTQMQMLETVKTDVGEAMNELSIVLSRLTIDERLLRNALSGEGYRNGKAERYLERLCEARQMIGAIVQTYEESEAGGRQS